MLPPRSAARINSSAAYCQEPRSWICSGASLRQSAIVEDIDHKAPRGLDRALFQKLVAGEWIARHQNLLVIGPTGVGKSWIACALGHKVCRDDRSVLYHRVPRLFDALALARGDGRYAYAAPFPPARAENRNPAKPASLTGSDCPGAWGAVARARIVALHVSNGSLSDGAIL